jgi:hypothetical protein
MLAPRRSFLTATLAAILGVATVPLPADAGSVERASILLTTTYFLKVDLSYQAGTIAARERITITNRSGGPITKVNLSVVPRAFDELAWIGDYSVDRVPTTAAWTNRTNLEVQLGRVLDDDATAVIRLGFKLRASSRISTSLEGRLSKANGIMQVSHWFPIVSTGHDVRYPGDAQYTRTAKEIKVQLRTESSGVRIAAPGRIITSSGRDHVFALANARDLAFGASRTYVRTTGSAGGVTIKVFTTSASAATAMSVAKSAIVKYESLFGQYQWPTFVIAQTGRPGSGNEYPGIVFLGQGVLTNREAIAHETAHQWWYGMVGNDQLKAPWLDEGIAEYVAATYYGDLEPYVSSRPIDSAVTDFPDVPAPLTSADPDSYDQTVYFKAARFLAGLRSRMGTSAFIGGMRQLFAENRNGTLTTAEFVEVMLERGAPPAYIDAFIRG